MAGIVISGGRKRFGQVQAQPDVSLRVALTDMAPEVRRLLLRRN